MLRFLTDRHDGGVQQRDRAEQFRRLDRGQELGNVWTCNDNNGINSL